MIDAKDYYLWDNWLCYSQSRKMYFRFSLVAPRTVVPVDRHFCAELHMWKSKDLTHWDYVNPVLKPGTLDGQEVQAVWTGSAHCRGDEIVLFFSALNSTSDFHQMIGQVHLSYDGEVKNVRLPVVIPDENLGYVFTDDDGSIPAWRDPFVFFNSSENLWHMVFAAKNKNFSPFHSCLGHATSDDIEAKRWNLREPISIDCQAYQVETPSLFSFEEQFYCGFAVKLYNPHETADNIDFHWYEASSIKGPWKRAQNLDKRLTEATSQDDTYGWKIFWNSQSPQGWSMAGFNAESSPNPFTWTPVINF